MSFGERPPSYREPAPGPPQWNGARPASTPTRDLPAWVAVALGAPVAIALLVALLLRGPPELPDMRPPAPIGFTTAASALPVVPSAVYQAPATHRARPEPFHYTSGGGRGRCRDWRGRFAPCN